MEYRWRSPLLLLDGWPIEVLLVKPPFLGGLGVLFLSTLLFAVGRKPAILVVARCLQGASAGIIYTVGLSMLVETVGRDEVGSWMGLTLSGMTSGVMIGPLVGGLIYTKVGYYAVFAVVLAFIALSSILPLFMIENRLAREWLTNPGDQRDGYGTISNKPDGDHSSRPTVHIPSQDPQSRVSTSSREPCHEEDPLLRETLSREPLPTERPGIAHRLAQRFPTTCALMSSGRLVAAMYGGFVQTSLICSFDGILPMFVHRTFVWNSSATGLIFLAISVPAITAPLIGALSDRFGTSIIVLTGFTLSTLSLALLSLVTENSIQHKVLLSILLALTGLGLTTILSPLAADMFGVVVQMGKDNEGLFGRAGAYAQAYGLFDTALALGTIFGPTYAGLLYEKAGWRPAVWGLAAFCASGSIPIIGSSISRK
ncbi:hypothetical protein GJ744_006997 [Endocarpon pusillum]|uniref:Major facilitator superfamily (MFS) profile domain-containing protein n=1 Tax=Endocarpon pusillum TaxID=364733 RepID=A0A8H7A7V5_9EURO|nr:hypothetical protein GJ744_006997 [Endocarpon pusillum]